MSATGGRRRKNLPAYGLEDGRVTLELALLGKRGPAAAEPAELLGPVVLALDVHLEEGLARLDLRRRDVQALPAHSAR